MKEGQQEKGALVSQKEKHLHRRLDRLTNVLNQRLWLRKIALGLGLMSLIGSPIAFFFDEHKNSLYLLGYGILLVFGAAFLRTRIRGLEFQILDVQNQLDMMNLSDASDADRAERLFKLHEFELMKYYNQTLNQGSVIFFIGIFCIFLGFGIIGYTIYHTASYPNDNPQEQIITASLGAFGGVLSNFIGVIYIKMFSETVKSMSMFRDRLVATHHLHFGNFLIAKIDDSAKRDNTLSKVAENVSEVYLHQALPRETQNAPR